MGGISFNRQAKNRRQLQQYTLGLRVFCKRILLRIVISHVLQSLFAANGNEFISFFMLALDFCAGYLELERQRMYF